jgi:hypothetical protein
MANHERSRHACRTPVRRGMQGMAQMAQVPCMYQAANRNLVCWEHTSERRFATSTERQAR